jgi:hypothetical protein
MTSQALPLSSPGLAITPEVLPIGGEARRLRLPGSALTPDAPRSLAEVVDREVIAYRAWGTPSGDFLARQMERLAQLIRWTRASTPEEHETRMEIWDEEIREQWFDRGYHEGYEAGLRDAGRGRRTDRD